MYYEYSEPYDMLTQAYKTATDWPGWAAQNFGHYKFLYMSLAARVFAWFSRKNEIRLIAESVINFSSGQRSKKTNLAP